MWGGEDKGKHENIRCVHLWDNGYIFNSGKENTH